MSHAGYVSTADLKNYIGLTGSGQDTNISNAIQSASRQIDRICGRRFFQDATANAKTFTPKSNLFLETPDISTTTGLIVKLDTTDNGSYDKTLTIDTDFIVMPTNPRVLGSGAGEHEPYTEIRILNTRSSERFDPDIINNVQITAKFGFAIIPEDIKQATLIQGLRLFKRKDTPFNVFGNETTGTIELFNKFDPDAMSLLKNFRRLNLVGELT
ncbi:MAG: hypothetical protein Tp156SUR915002_40 [Prokaryotic dsDNA virus sp.]|jgi:hypothetical protein|nr:MAG: hypothetical protein Tp162SUR384061_49 [Prokaryotic dsDNA virus sp.]QDP59779.1 MAG: hypothetical protein Tp156SUR915002_40 [Prokaryotic dsDNA virus sp.]|tara:strand:- start:7904 stop:8542 length:639 start_codon:yes stop_codon:yes gene_type:complete